MAGKHDDKIRKLREEGKGGRLIGAALNLNPGYVSRRLKAMGLNGNQKNQYKPSDVSLDVKCLENLIGENYAAAAENFLRFLCNLMCFDYADPSPYQPYDLLVDFGHGWKRVQVKTTILTDFRLCRSTNRMVDGERKFGHEVYKDGEIDYFFLFRRNGRCWLVPFSEVKGKTSVRPEVILPGFEIAHRYVDKK